MEEIDIIELLKRENEGKAPKVIEIQGTKFYSSDTENDIEKLYIDDCGNPWFTRYIDVKTKIKILDKPIIEELDYKLEGLEDATYNESWLMNCIRANKNKINEIIRYIKKESEEK